MLNDLESLSANISRLLHTVEVSRGALAERDGQLARVRVERDEALTTNHALRAERDRLREERDALLSKIEDAQIKLNAILEKLPSPRLSEPTDSEAAEAGHVDVHTDSHAHAEAQHVDGENHER